MAAAPPCCRSTSPTGTCCRRSSPTIKDEFRLSDTQLGLLSAAFLLVVSVGAVPFGVLVDRSSRTAVAAWGCALWSTAMVLTALTTSFGWLFAARTALGVAEASYSPASFSLLTDAYPVQERGRVLGLYQTGSALGFLGLPLGAVLATAYGWRAAFCFFALPGFVLAVLVRRLPEPPRGAQDRAHHGVQEAPPGASPVAQTSGLAPFLLLLRTPTVPITLLTFALATAFTSGLGIWATTFLVRFHDLSVPQASAVASLLAVGAISGALLGGWAGDRLLARGRVTGRIHVAGWAMIGGCALLLPAFATDSTPLMVVLFGLGAVTLTVPLAPLSATRADVVHPDLRGRLASVGALLSAAAAAGSPLLLGVLSDAAGLRTALIGMLPLLLVGGVLLLVLAPRHLAADQAAMRASLGAPQEAP